VAFLFAFGCNGTWPPAIGTGMDVMVPMPDGTRLVTDIYAPSGGGPWPVILLRTPYDPSDPVHAGRAAEYTPLGVVYIVQNSRGHFGSEGQVDFFGTDRQDARDMITLLAAQSWCNGRIAMQGHSAPGIEAYMGLPNTNSTPADLACAWIEMATPDLYRTCLQNGVFRKRLVEDWLTGTSQASFISQIVDNWTNASWWSGRRLGQDYDKIAAPAVHLTGWFDIFTNDQIDAFLAARQAGAPSQYLIIGPWTHDGVDLQEQGELTFPANVNLSTWQLFEDFMARYLFDDGSISSWPAVRYYTMGDVDTASGPGNEWRTASTWPPYTANPTRYYLRTAGALSTTQPGATEEPDQYSYDPTDPAPTVGGNNLFLGQGPADQRTVEARADVLTYSSNVLTTPIEVTGKVQAKIYLQCDRSDSDLLVRLTDVYPDGRSMLVTEGVLGLRFRNPNGPAAGTLMTSGQTYEIDMELWPTSIVFNTGHRIRIAVTSSSDPKFEPNPNTGADLRENNNTATATVTILHNQANPSQIMLPTP
jgi:predicted acyl esterase